MNSYKRIKEAGTIGHNLSIEQRVLLENLIEYGNVSVKHFEQSAIARRPLLPIVKSLCSFGHRIYMEVDLDQNGEEIEESRVFYMDDASFITERRLGMPDAVSIPEPNIDFER